MAAWRVCELDEERSMSVKSIWSIASLDSSVARALAPILSRSCSWSYARSIFIFFGLYLFSSDLTDDLRLAARAPPITSLLPAKRNCSMTAILSRFSSFCFYSLVMMSLL